MVTTGIRQGQDLLWRRCQAIVQLLGVDLLWKERRYIYIHNLVNLWACHLCPICIAWGL